MKKSGIFFNSIRNVKRYLRDYRFKSILIKYFLLLLITLVLPITGLNIYYAKKNLALLRKEAVMNNEASLEKACNNVELIWTSMKNTAYSIGQIDELKYIAYSKDNSSYINELNVVTNIISVLQVSNQYIDSIYVYMPITDKIITEDGMLPITAFGDNGWLELCEQLSQNRTLLVNRKKKETYPYLITILYPIFNDKEKGSLGTVIINIDVEKLGKYMGSGSYRNKDNTPMLFIFDNNMENLIYSDEYRLLKYVNEIEDLYTIKEFEKSFSEEIFLWDKYYIVSGKRSEQDNLLYVFLSDMQEYVQLQNDVETLYLSIMLLSLFGCIVLSFFLAIWVYQPIQKTMQVLENASMLIAWDKKDNIDEVKAIQYSILEAKKQTVALNEQIEEKMLNLQSAQICALQSQINPHFMYNTLESIGNMAALLIERENPVSDILFVLGRFLRTSLSGENYLVPLAEELDHVGLYMKIIDFRYQGGIKFHIEVPEEMREKKIVKLTLQPLIENAVLHGLIQKKCRGDIWVRCIKKEKMVELAVVDNGIGMSDEKIEHLQQKIETPIIVGTKHIGLRNVNQRLKLVFGDDYGLRITKAREGGICVIVKIRLLDEV